MIELESTQADTNYSYIQIAKTERIEVPILHEAAAIDIQVLYWFIRISKRDGLRQRFNPILFAGLLEINKVLLKRMSKILREEHLS
ncbi:hypothetical protein HLB03_11485 [Acidianus sp. DSM 29099]|nr:hypothetical protein [Acidianus sp. RZ1]